jgi:hypothetical protein
MSDTPTPDELTYVNRHTRAFVRAHRPRCAQFWGWDAASSPPVNTVPPEVTGAGTVGATLTTDDGSWDNAPTAFAYQWRRNGTNIFDANSAAYVLVDVDSGTDVFCTVTASNAAGDTPQDSNLIAVA